MLIALSIQDFVSIDRLDFEPGSGFAALTGETGAGKSILLEALGVALGGPPQKRFVRQGAGQAIVSAEFVLGPGHAAFARLEEAGVAVDRAAPLSLKRVLRAEGPTRGFIADQSVSAALLSEIGDMLVEVHGQHANTDLLRPSSHRRLLDAFGGLGPDLEAVQSSWRDWQAAAAHVGELREAVEAARRDRAFLENALEEFESVDPQAGEFGRLTDERQMLQGVRKVAEAIGECRTLIEEGADERLGAAARALSRAHRAAGEEGALAMQLGACMEGLERALIEAQEVADVLDHLIAGQADAANQLEGIDARLFALKTLARKHGGLPDELPELHARLRAALATLESGEADLQTAIEAEAATAAAYRARAEALTRARVAAAQRLDAAVADELEALHLGRARFRVSVAAGEPGANGADVIAFEIATSPSAAFGPLSQIASGGELARFSLALKVALAETGSAGLMIFDEVDQGVGGAVATAIGERLSRLASGRQVFAVTHSAQVAACGDEHWRVEKAFGENGLGQTHLTALDEATRRDEIARMLSGREITGEARAAAGRLLGHGPERTQRERAA